jgi:hypothetical protein
MTRLPLFMIVLAAWFVVAFFLRFGNSGTGRDSVS